MNFSKNNDIDLLCTYIYVFIGDDELKLHKRAVSIKYLLRVILNFSNVIFMFYFKWMLVNGYCIL